MLDIQGPQPALLAHRGRDEKPDFDDFGFAKMLVERVPKRVAGL